MLGILQDTAACRTMADASKWLRMLSAELANRMTVSGLCVYGADTLLILAQVDEEMFSRQPKTLVLHYLRVGGFI
jgi:hypothetical protein